MGACAQLPDARGMAGHQVAPLQLCQPPPPPWDHAALSPKHPALELHSAPTQRPEPSQPRGSGVGGISSHHSAPPVALDGKIWAEEQVSNGQEQGLGQRPGILVIIFSRLRTQHPGPSQWELAKERRPQDLGGGRRTGSGPRRSLGQNQSGLGQ